MPSSTNGFELLLRGFRMASCLSPQGIAVIRQFSPSRCTLRHSSMIGSHRPRSPGASAARHSIRRCRKFIVDFPRLCLFDGPTFNAKVLSHEPVRRQFGNLAPHIRCIGLGPHAISTYSTVLERGRHAIEKLVHGEWVEANPKALGLRGADAAKAIGVMRSNFTNSVTAAMRSPEIAVRFEGPFGGGADLWLRMQAAHDLAKVRRSQEKITVRGLARPVESLQASARRWGRRSHDDRRANAYRGTTPGLRRCE